MSFKELTPAEWFEREIDPGLEYRRRFGLEDMWGQFEAIYYNTHESMMNDGPNIFLSQGDAMLSTITVPSPRIRVKPTTPEEVDKAPIVESLDNKLLRELELSREVEIASLHAYLWGRGIIKSGYDSEWGYDPELDVAGKLRYGMTLTQLNRQGDRRIEHDANVSPGQPWAKAVMPHDIVVPWGVRDLDDSPWIAHRVVRQIDELKADRKYSNTRELRGQMSMEDFVNSYRQAQAGKLRSWTPGSASATRARSQDYVELYEIHDRRTGRIKVITRDYNEFLRDDFNALQIDNRLPFSAVSFTPRSRSFWTTPDAYYLYYIQSELSDVARQRTKQRRISTLKFLYDSDSISEEELQKILSPDVGVAAKVEGGRDIASAITKLDNQPNPGLAQEEDLLRANAREQIGFSRNQLGEFSGGRKTATEAQVVEQASRLRMSRRGLMVKRLYEDVIRTTNGIVFTYWTMPRYIEALSPSRAQIWMAINGPALRGRYSYDIEFVESSELQARKMEALQLYSMLSQDPSIDPLELRSFLGNQINDPAFERLFSASVRNGVSEVRASGGNPPAQTSGGNGAAPRGLPQLSNPNGANGQPTPTRLLA